MLERDLGPTGTPSNMSTPTTSAQHDLDRSSSRYRVSVYEGAGSPQWNHCYSFGKAGYATARSPARYEELTWDEGDSIEVSWSGWGATGTSVVRVYPAVAGQRIDRVTIYPKHLNIDYSLDEGLVKGEYCRITVPADTRLYIEMTLQSESPTEDNRKDVLLLWAEPLAASIPSGSVVNITSQAQLNSYSNGFPSGSPGVPAVYVFDPGIYRLPTIKNTFTAGGPLDPNRTAIIRECDHMLFELGDWTRVYLKRGAWVIGSWDCRLVTDTIMLGPGTLSGEHVTWDQMASSDYTFTDGVIQGPDNQYINPGQYLNFKQQAWFPLFLGGDSDGLGDNVANTNGNSLTSKTDLVKTSTVLLDVMCAGSPFMVQIGMWDTESRVKKMTHTYLNLDVGSGRLFAASKTPKQLTDRVMWLAGDDGWFPGSGAVITNSHIINWGGAPANFGYFGGETPGGELAQMSNCTLMTFATGPNESQYLAGPDLYTGFDSPVGWFSPDESTWPTYFGSKYTTPTSFNGCVFRGTMDTRPGAADNAGFYDGVFENIFVEGELRMSVFSFMNAYYPWGDTTVNNANPATRAKFDKKGSIGNWTFKNIQCEFAPTYRNRIIGRDRLNTPYDLTFENVTFAGVKLTGWNYDEYFLQDAFPHNIFVEGRHMTTAEAICNTALMHIGESATISAINPPDGSALSILCNQIFNQTVEELLDMHQWSFATVRANLAETATNDLAGWKYSYLFPADALKALQVLPDGEKDRYVDPRTRNPNEYTIEQAVSGDLVLYTDVEDAQLRYVKYIYAPNKFSPLFITALGWLLASKLAGPVMKGDVGAAEAKRCLQMAQFYIGKAASSDSNQRRTDTDHTAPWMSNR